MKNKSTLLFIAALIVLLFATQAVMAEGNNDISYNLAINNIDNNINCEIDHDGASIEESANAGSDKLSTTESDTLNADEEGTFSELAELISNSDGELELTKNYKYNPDVDSNYKNGITINKPIKILGNAYTIDGNNNAKAFYIPSASNVILNNIKFINGNSSKGQGGAIEIGGDNCIVTDCVFENNAATQGGAIYWSGNGGKLTDSVFINNVANTKGGAIFSRAPLDIEFSTFENNKATNDGGAIYTEQPINIEYSDFINNAANFGGATYIMAENSNITSSSFQGNTAETTGGAVYCSGNNNVIKSSTLENNKANDAGGAVILNGLNGKIIDSQIYNNEANQGGAIYWNGNNGTLIDTTVRDNKAKNKGGAVYWRGNNATIDEAWLTGNEAKTGGAIYFDQKSDNSKILDSHIHWNHAEEAGAIYSESKNTFVNNTEFTHNYAYSETEKSGHAGAIELKGDNSIINASTFIGNTAYDWADGNADSGAIRVMGDNVTVNNTYFEGNQANANGGAINWLGKDGKLDNSTFYRNDAYTMGGAVKWIGSNALINNTDFIENVAELFRGGGLSFETNGIIDNSRFIKNTAHKGGGIYWLPNEKSVINNSYFEDNYAYYGGAGVSCDYNYGNADKKICNSTFVGNTAHNYGGAIASLDTEVIDSTFKDNKAHIGGAIHSYDSKITNSKFSGNTADYGNDLYYSTEPNLVNTDIPKENIEVVPGELIEIVYPIGNSTRMTNVSYVAMCTERYTYYPYLGAEDKTLRGLINIESGEDIGEYLKILVYTYFNSTDDVYPHEGDNFVFYPEYMRGDPNRWDYATKIPRPDYYSRAVHEFSDHDFRNSDHPVVKKVLELYDSGFRVENNALKYVDGVYVRYNFSSMISPASQSLFIFNMDNLTPNMTVQKIALNTTSPLYVGDLVAFNITVKNTGDFNLSDITVKEIYSNSQLKYVKFTGTNWSKNGDVFTYGKVLNINQSATFTVWFKALTTGTLQNNVTAKSNMTNETPGNNTTTISNPKLTVQKITLNKVVKVGEQVAFVIVVKNTGDCVLNGVYVVEQKYSKGLVFDHMLPNKNWKFDGKNKFTYTKALGVGESANFTVIFNATSIGFKVNNVIAGSNNTNETVNSTNTTKVVNNTVPKNETVPPEKPIPPKPTTTVEHKHPRDVPVTMHPTGNPILALLMMSLVIPIIRTKRKN